MSGEDRFAELVSETLLRELVEDTNVRWIMLSATGRFSYLKLGRRRGSDDILSREIVAELANCVGAADFLRWGEWIIRSFDGLDGKVLLIERLPAAAVDRLPTDVLNHLKRQIRKDSNGVLIGEPGSSKGALLLWLAMQIPDEPVLLVSENPPSELPGSHVTHVFPPSSDSERRVFQRLVRLNATVFWDRVTGSEDLRSLFGFPGAKRRWFTLDSSSVASGLRMLLGVMTQGTDARVETILALSSSVIGRPEVRNLLINDDDQWAEEFKAEGSALETVFAFAAHDMDELGLTGRSAMSGLHPSIPPTTKIAAAQSAPAEGVSPIADQEVAPPAPAPAPDPLPEIPEPKEKRGVHENTAAGESADPEYSNTPLPAPIAKELAAKEAAVANQKEDLPEFPEAVDPSGLDSGSHAQSGILKKVKKKPPKKRNQVSSESTSVLHVDEYPEDPDDEKTGLLSADELTSISNIKASGEIDLQGFIARRDGVDNLPEETRQYDYSQQDSPTSNADAELLKEILPNMRNYPTPPDLVNMEDLRITRAEEFEIGDLDDYDDDDLDFTSRSDNFNPRQAFEAAKQQDPMEDDVRTSVASAQLLAQAALTPGDGEDTYERQLPDGITSPRMDSLHYDIDETEEVELDAAKLAQIQSIIDRKKQ